MNAGKPLRLQSSILREPHAHLVLTASIRPAWRRSVLSRIGVRLPGTRRRLRLVPRFRLAGKAADCVLVDEGSLRRPQGSTSPPSSTAGPPCAVLCLRTDFAASVSLQRAAGAPDELAGLKTTPLRRKATCAHVGADGTPKLRRTCRVVQTNVPVTVPTSIRSDRRGDRLTLAGDQRGLRDPALGLAIPFAGVRATSKRKSPRRRTRLLDDSNADRGARCARGIQRIVCNTARFSTNVRGELRILGDGRRQQRPSRAVARLERARRIRRGRALPRERDAAGALRTVQRDPRSREPRRVRVGRTEWRRLLRRLVHRRRTGGLVRGTRLSHAPRQGQPLRSRRWHAIAVAAQPYAMPASGAISTAPTTCSSRCAAPR